MTHADYFMTSLCLWREARGEGNDGMFAVACVLKNRVSRRDSSFYVEVIRPWQFSSITAKGDRQLIVYPPADDSAWVQAQLIAANVIDHDVRDTTEDATLYYDDSISFPASWNRAHVVSTVKIGRLNFFREI